MATQKKQWVSWEELYAIIGGDWTPASGSGLGGFIEGSIPFADSDGILTEDNPALFWDAAGEFLKITSASTLLIDLHPGFTGTGEVIKITPSAAIATIDAEWDGILIDGAALDPSAIGVQIDGLHIDFSTIDLTNFPHLDGIYIQMPSILDGFHAIHLEGELHINLDAASAVTGMTYTGLDVVIATAGSTGGDLHVLDVARSGAGDVSIAAVATHEGIDVIHQEIGTFAAADRIWEYDADGAPWINVTAGVASIWDDKDDLLYVGHASTFSEIKFIFSDVATKNMHFKFYFSIGGAGWTQFYPADDTEGATQNGSVRYTAASLPTWAVDTVEGIADKYWIKIERTRTAGVGPTTSSMEQLAPTLYGWDKLGAITALSLSTGTLESGKLTVNSGEAESIILKGTSSGDENRCWIGFYDSDGTTRRGYVGDSSDEHDDIVLAADTGDVKIKSVTGNVTMLSDETLALTLDTSQNAIFAGTIKSPTYYIGDTTKEAPSKTTGAWNKSIGGGGDYLTWAAMIVDMPDLIAHAVTVTIEAGTTLTEICNIRNKHGLTSAGIITIQAERYYPTASAIPTADSATATTLRDAELATAALGDDYFNGCWILIVDGTGTDNDFVLITDYDDGNGDVVVASWPGTQPDNTSRYIIVGALIDGEGARASCMAVWNCTAIVALKGIGFTDATWANLEYAYSFRLAPYYCGFTKCDYSAIYSANSFVLILYRDGIVNNNTLNTADYGGITIISTINAEVGECGFSDNNQFGVGVQGGGYSIVYSCFGDGNGAWGGYAKYSGQVRFVGTECSGAAGNHSDPGTAGNANADQAAAY